MKKSRYVTTKYLVKGGTCRVTCPRVNPDQPKFKKVNWRKKK